MEFLFIHPPVHHIAGYGSRQPTTQCLLYYETHSPISMIKPTLFMAAIRPAGAAGSAATAAVAGALLALLGLLAAAALCSGSSAAGGDEAELIVSTAGAGSMGTTTRQQVMVPAMYVFGDSLVDAGNNDFLPAPAPKAVPPNGVDLPRTISRRTGRFTNGYNLADIIGKVTLRLSRNRSCLPANIRSSAPVTDRRTAGPNGGGGNAVRISMS